MGGGGFKNCPILQTDSTDRLREMRMKGGGGSKNPKILRTSFKYGPFHYHNISNLALVVFTHSIGYKGQLIRDTFCLEKNSARKYVTCVENFVEVWDMCIWGRAMGSWNMKLTNALMSYLVTC